MRVIYFTNIQTRRFLLIVQKSIGSVRQEAIVGTKGKAATFFELKISAKFAPFSWKVLQII